MAWTSSLALTSTVAFACALVLALVTAAVAFVRRPAVPVLTHVLVAVGLVLLSLAAGGLTWRRPAGEVVVMVDLSPSTRTARYREAAALRERVGQLLGDVPYRLEYFAGGPPSKQQADQLNASRTLPDLLADRTVYAPPTAAAVLLFSDGRFDPPASAPPTFAVIDPALESAADAAVEKLQVRGDDVAVTMRNSGTARELSLSGVAGAASVAAPAGDVVFSRPLVSRQAGTPVTARLVPGDAWPENDALTMYVPPPPQAQQWWITAAGTAPAPATGAWTTYGPSDLPTETTPYLAPSVIALDNVAATDLTVLQLQRLAQYVRDLGGGLVILGGDRAFAAGQYSGTPLESLSPLASTAPDPAATWVVLVDSSGSMNAPAGGSDSGAGAAATRWRVAAEAAAGLVRSLPPNDRVSVGGFAAAVTWWTRDRRAADAASDPLPPPGAAPSGPTELRHALEEITASAPGPPAPSPPASRPAPPTHLVLLTDGNAALPDADALAAAMRRRNVRLHLLAIGDGAGLSALRRLVEATGGTLLREADPGRWAEAARTLLRGATPDLVRRDAARVRFLGDLRALPAREVAPWNRTWLKDGATPLAEGAGPEEVVPMAARWAAGNGTVLAAAFGGATSEEVDAFLRLTRQPPRDPRLRVTWDAGARLRVAVDAVDTAAEAPGLGAYLNRLELSLSLQDAGRPDAPASVARLAQTAPGRYELTLDALRTPAVATLRLDRSAAAVDRFPVAGRYAAEFDAIGNDRAALRELATRSGGALVEPSARGPLDIPRPRRDVPLRPALAAAGAACVALGLIRWRRW